MKFDSKWGKVSRLIFILFFSENFQNQCGNSSLIRPQSSTALKVKLTPSIEKLPTHRLAIQY